MSVGSRGIFNAPYEPLLFDVLRLPFPNKGSEHLTIERFEELLQTRSAEIATLILEPLVLGAAGMLMYQAATLRALSDLCRRYGILLIADEVLTGWGRTGTRFACEQAGVAPDVMCLSKGLTSGFLPLGATLASEAIYQAFYSVERAKTFFHSSSFTGNPLACAAASAALEVWDEEPVFERIAAVHQHEAALLPRLKVRTDIEDVRHHGTILACDVRTEQQGYLSAVAPLLYRYFIEQGVLLRPIGQTIYVLPPYCASREDLNVIVDTIERALDALRNGELEQAA
jgi:adenosylmethionine-8-amino-7-oxononanoate aminotransferase